MRQDFYAEVPHVQIQVSRQCTEFSGKEQIFTGGESLKVATARGRARV